MIYFDNSATTRVDSDIAQVAAEAMTKNFGNPLQIVSFYGMINLYSSEPVSTSWYRLLPYLCGLPCRCRNQHRKILIKGDTTYAVWLL